MSPATGRQSRRPSSHTGAEWRKRTQSAQRKTPSRTAGSVVPWSLRCPPLADACAAGVQLGAPGLLVLLAVPCSDEPEPAHGVVHAERDVEAGAFAGLGYGVPHRVVLDAERPPDVPLRAAQLAQHVGPREILNRVLPHLALDPAAARAHHADR